MKKIHSKSIRLCDRRGVLGLYFLGTSIFEH